MAFYFLLTIVEFTRGIQSLFQIQGIQQDCVHRRLGGERERKKIVQGLNLFLEYRRDLQQWGGLRLVVDPLFGFQGALYKS